MSSHESIELVRSNVSRRAVLGASAGLSFAFTFGIGGGAPRPAHAATGASKINAYVTIAASGAITIRAPSPEMGQGVLTSLPLIVAEELDADWSKVTVEAAPLGAEYNHPIFRAQYVVASLSVFGYWTPLRVAGAQARRVLIEAAAAKWGVPATELTTEPSVVVHAGSGRKLGYGEIAADAKPPAELPKIDPAKDLKPASQYRLLGKDVPRIDMLAKSNGSAVYGIDVQVPDMVYATLARAPVRGSGPESSNADMIKKLTGVLDVVTLGHGVAVVGYTFEAVRKARQQLKVRWKQGAPGDSINTDKDLATYLAHGRDASRVGEVWRTKGDAAVAMAGAARVMTREFLCDHYYHAQMEPMNSTAVVRGDTAEIWVGTQALTRTAVDVAAAIGTTVDKVKVHQHFLGGGYGRRASVEASVDAALIAKAVGKPVKFILLREDDIASGTFRPMTAQKVDVGFDKDGQIVAWRQRVVGEPVAAFLYSPAFMAAQKNKDIIFMSGAEVPHYAVDNLVSEHVMEPERTRVGAWRGIGSGYTKFAVESVIDEIAHEKGVDPVEFRLSLITNPRVRAVVQKAAAMAEWQRKRSDTALGIGFAEYGASLSAGVAEISVDRQSGKIRVHNFWAAVDAGLPLQPANIAAQVEGAIVWGLSQSLKERITMEGGVVQQSNYHDYEILRMAETPEIKVEVLRSIPNPTMVGELGVPTAAPAVANAFFALTGKRLRHMPFTPERVLAALKA